MADVTELESAKPAAPVAPPAPPARGNAVRQVTLVVLLLVVGLFVYGLFADRLTPYTDQASVQAYVVNLAPDVAGRVSVVNVADNQQVRAGQVLFAIDPERYQIAANSAAAQLSTAGQSVGASTASLESAQARLAVAEANLANARLQSARVLDLVQHGVRSPANADEATAALRTAVADVGRARADVEEARQNLGPQGPSNPQIRQAQAGLNKAQRDVRDTVVRAPSNGAVTSLQLAPGRFLGAGQTALTFIDSDVIWIDAELRENALEHIEPGDRVSIVLDVRPGRVYSGKVESIGWGVDDRDVDPQTGLPAIRNDSGWVREPQRFPVRVKFDPDDGPGGVRVGSQASAVIYTGKSGLTDAVGRLWIGLVSYLTYLS